MSDESVGSLRHHFKQDAKIEDVKSFYDGHVDEYDKDLASTTQLYPGASSAVDTLLEAVGEEENVNIKILDLGAGTGILSVALNKRGFSNIDAIDLSQKMLDKAKERNLYKNYFCEAVEDKRLDIPTGTYDAVISAGAVSSGMIKPIAFDEISRLVRPGGYISFTLRKDVYDGKEYGYQQKFQTMQDEGKWQEFKSFVTQYIDGRVDMQKECYVFCYKVL